MYTLRSVAMTYGGQPVLADIDLDVARGERVAIIGPSGSGKSTLLYLMAGLLPPASGSLLIDGQPVESHKQKLAIILQDYGLFPWLTAEANVALPLLLRGVARDDALAAARERLAELDLAPLARRFPTRLSGGQRQRVAIARALAGDPEVLLMDEPFSALDALTRERLQDTLLSIWQRRRLTVVMVTHSIEEAAYIGQRVLVLSPDPGRITADLAVGGFADRVGPAFHEACRALRLALGGAGDDA
ncbi:MAG: ABC transporter ATP-binding protein [Chloroflexota bacterium]